MKPTFLFLLSVFLIGSYEVKAATLDYIEISKERFFPEGIARDKEGNLYVGSIATGDIVKIEEADKEVKPFISAEKGGLVSSIGLNVEDASNTLWVCSSDPGVAVRTKKDPVALKAFDLKTGDLKGTYPLPGGGFCNDITFDKAGNVYVTDSFNPRILKLAKDSKNLETWIEAAYFEGQGFNLNGIDYDGMNALYVVRYNSGQLFRIKISSKKIEEIKMPRKLVAADGLKVLDARTLLVIEGDDVKKQVTVAGGGKGKLTKIVLDRGRAKKLIPLQEGLNVPTTFVISGDHAWVVESQYDRLFTYQNLPHYPFYMVKVPLK